MEFATIPAKDLRHTRVAQEWIEEGRQEGEAKVALRQLDRRCGPLSNATTARNQALLDFSGPADWRPGWPSTVAKAQNLAGQQAPALTPRLHQHPRGAHGRIPDGCR